MAPATPPQVPRHELSYTKVLSELFADRLQLCNAPDLVLTHGKYATTPEFALGRVRAQLQARDELVGAVTTLIGAATKLGLSADARQALSAWLLARDDPEQSPQLGERVIEHLEALDFRDPAVDVVLARREHLRAVSRWIVGSDAWSRDIGFSGLHHAIASGLNVNILVLDTVPYSTRDTADPETRKKDVGLYAMNYGNVYVASIALYASFMQMLQAFTEADKFPGPSVVVAHLPYTSDASPSLDVLKETKLAVDSGYWPLYRWDPTKEDRGIDPFSLDSEAVKASLQEFLDRQNHMSLLTRTKPEFATALVTNLGDRLKEARTARADKAFDELVNSLGGPPLLVLYASDGGAAEKIAKRLADRAKARGLPTRCATLDSTPLADIAQEGRVLFVTSTAGQGEPPQNGRDTFKLINAAVARGDKLAGVQYGVFGMGDSHYWPRAEDTHYYNKPGKDLDGRLEQLGAERLIPLGLGDDQDADGPQTGYKAWEPLVWKALGVADVEVTEAEPEPVTNEHIKIASNYLRGTIVEGLQDTSTGALAASDGQLTKFHGIYEQDDRDIRDERKDQGLEPAFAFMIRCRLPGGVCTPEQWLAIDQIADEHGNGTFKLTTRQTFQFHGVIKRHLKPAIQDINRCLLDTIAACGDVNRNVIVSSMPQQSQVHAEAYAFAKKMSDRFLPKTTAYHEIWLDKKLVAGNAVQDFEPLYGPYYMPRKFKMAVAIPPNNDIDVFCNDLGFIAILGEDGHLEGFNVSAGGGMGVTHAMKRTYPRLGDVLGFCTVEQGYAVGEAVMTVQRDNGNRADRKNARLKYTIDRLGLATFKSMVEKLLGWEFAPARPYKFESNVDPFGWSTDYLGKHHFVTFIENGRVEDAPGHHFKTGLREIAKVHKGNFRLTANQHVIVSDVDEEDLSQIKDLLARYKLDNLAHSGLRLSSSACVAFPTCGLAMAESERYLPVLVDKVEKICEEHGLRHDSIVMRMSGCPNGCSRPYAAEVAFVGKAPGSYLMLLGGGYYGQRLNKIYRENVTEPEILAILGPMIKRYALEREEGERFGDFVIRAGYIAPTTAGALWYEGMGGEGEHREVAAAA
ncbi:putative sulfite reductase cys-4 [Exidia glandulosa HHB12029]|uniref:assimilatory sulfite reductase (NADPH) n=1 Tax=Exidia glandulosa HHB12029 TaxID=1314781 RepID=A0A165DYX9_EXIGL|nr:putative sulfite reductase cys-4 [Exidia glandulosa HHB12029]